MVPASKAGRGYFTRLNWEVGLQLRQRSFTSAAVMVDAKSGVAAVEAEIPRLSSLPDLGVRLT